MEIEMRSSHPYSVSWGHLIISCMKIYGIDFTSSPGPKKAITFAQCRLTEEGLVLERPGSLTSFEQ